MQAQTRRQRRLIAVTDDAGDAAALQEVERERLRALVAGDIQRAAPLHAEDFQLINPAGGALSKEDYLDLISSGAFRYRVWEPEPISVRLHGASAVIRYRATIEAVVDGTRSRRGRYWHTDLYERRDGRWRVVWSHATEIQ
jgi:uncharacterized protein (TIGR02246 family)